MNEVNKKALQSAFLFTSLFKYITALTYYAKFCNLGLDAIKEKEIRVMKNVSKQTKDSVSKEREVPLNEIMQIVYTAMSILKDSLSLKKNSSTNTLVNPTPLDQPIRSTFGYREG